MRPASTAPVNWARTLTERAHVTNQHPGAAFGLPDPHAHHPLARTPGGWEEPAPAPERFDEMAEYFAAAAAGPDTDAADAAADPDGTADPQAELTAALQNLAAARLADPELLAALLADADLDEYEDEFPTATEPEVDEQFAVAQARARQAGLTPREARAHAVALAAAARESELEAEVDAIYQAILRRAPEHDVQPSLQRVQRACELLGDPQLAYHTVHVTGTNGKTSTTRMISSLLRERGVSVGTFTSPHLHTVRERMRIGLEPLSREAFLEAWESVGPIVELVDAESVAAGGPVMSFFEVFTVLGFTAFANAGVEAAVIEVGMGGRWDATNVVQSAVQVITPIARDHTQWLGATLADIAREKAGILRPGGTVVVGPQPEEAAAVLAAAAAELDVTVRQYGPDFHYADRELAVGGQMCTLTTPAARYEDVYLPLHGEHQALNAATALVATEALFGGGALPPLLVEHGFAAASSPGRLEVVRSSPTVIVDGAHNPAGVAALRAALEETFGFSKLVGVFAAMADKDVEPMLAELEPLLESVVVTSLSSGRAMDADELGALAGEVFGPERVTVHCALPEALDAAVTLAEAGDDPAASTGVLVTGSLLLVAEARSLFGKATA
ncbi:bifunctional folylpolyglutamate synthase/dihydrofolate synthase [Buchananella hordeovulneris]|nr:bifunctional folylpolyglutamate synthase/dihydrofolate synthase [Buchananella hordeovulneris]